MTLIQFIFLVFILIISFLPILPAKIIYDIDYYFSNNLKIQRRKVTILQFFLQKIIDLISQIIIGIVVPLALRGSITIILFLVVGTDIYFRKSLSPEGVIITIVGVIALYLEQMTSSASEISFMGSLFKYKSK